MLVVPLRLVVQSWGTRAGWVAGWSFMTSKMLPQGWRLNIWIYLRWNHLKNDLFQRNISFSKVSRLRILKNLRLFCRHCWSMQLFLKEHFDGHESSSRLGRRNQGRYGLTAAVCKALPWTIQKSRDLFSPTNFPSKSHNRLWYFNGCPPNQTVLYPMIWDWCPKSWSLNGKHGVILSIYCHCFGKPPSWCFPKCRSPT